MVCLAASIVSKHGKVLVSRQFVEMNRIRVEGLLAAFPKLVGTGKQHTYVETENVRYVYQPMEGMYLLLITNKQSNILEDLETLRLLSKVVREYVDEVTESTVCDHAFELLFAFDEVISLGHKEEVTVAQVRQNTEMESNEEKLVDMVKKDKIKQVNELMKAKASEIDRERLEKKQGGGDPWRSMTAMGGGSRPDSSSVSMGINDGPSFVSTVPTTSTYSSTPTPPARTGPTKGMKLGKDKKNDLLSALAREGEAVDTSTTALAAPSAPVPVTPTDPVNISIDEKISVKLNKEGGLEHMELQGTLTLLCTEEQACYLQIAFETSSKQGMQFKTHPTIDKGMYAQSKLGLKDPSQPFKVNVPQGVLKWRWQTTDEAQVPITVNCWPTTSGSDTYINIEYESRAAYDLQQVVISIPGIFSAPKVNSCDGEWRFDSGNGCVLWTIDIIDDSNRDGAMELVADAAAPASFFPCTVSFLAKETICDIKVQQVTNTQTQAPAQFGFSKSLQTSRFEIVH